MCISLLDCCYQCPTKPQQLRLNHTRIVRITLVATSSAGNSDTKTRYLSVCPVLSCGTNKNIYEPQQRYYIGFKQQRKNTHARKHEKKTPKGGECVLCVTNTNIAADDLLRGCQQREHTWKCLPAENVSSRFFTNVNLRVFFCCCCAFVCWVAFRPNTKSC